LPMLAGMREVMGFVIASMASEAGGVSRSPRARVVTRVAARAPDTARTTRAQPSTQVAAMKLEIDGNEMLPLE
jgi:hypothetical protein